MAYYRITIEQIGSATYIWEVHSRRTGPKAKWQLVAKIYSTKRETAMSNPNRDEPPPGYCDAVGSYCYNGQYVMFVRGKGDDIWTAGTEKGQTYGPMRWKSLIDVLEHNLTTLVRP